MGRLDEIKTENEAKRKVQIISWQAPPPAQINNKSNKKYFIITRRKKLISNLIDPDELIHSESNNNDDDSTSSLFQRRTEPILPLVQPSPLTALIQSTINKQNPFAQYVKFDGTVCNYFSIIQINIFPFFFSLAKSEFKSIKKIYCSF